MDIVRQNFPENQDVLCPCRNCLNLELQSQSVVEEHVQCAGMSNTYTRWIFHGESLSDDEGGEMEDVAYTSDDDDFNEDNRDDVSYMVDDLARSGRRGEGQPNLYCKLIEEAKKELYEGCSEFTRLSFIIKLLHVKSYNRVTNRGFSMFLEVFSAAFPHADIPKSYEAAKSVLREAGLGYETIHVCKFDCALFWGNYANNTHCPECGTSRWKDTEGRKKIPHKVLRYFPIIPRLQRFFVSKEQSADARWHKEKRVAEKGVMRHPVDGEAWKHFDREYGWFAKDARNFRLGIATDGFNPFGNMSSSYSMWPVFVIPYNFPPWMCMDQSNFMMALLIPGKKAPGKEFHVFMQPLIADMMKLWGTGVETYDALTDDPFTLHAAFLWSIHDYPGLATLSGRSTRGYYACVHCDENPCSEALEKKIGYVGHRRFLPTNHRFRRSKDFNGSVEKREKPRKFTNAEVLEKLEKVKNFKPGKYPGNKKRKRTQKDEPIWSQKVSLYDLPYWSNLKLAYNIDVMHVEKNICENILGTLLEIEGKNKDTANARIDLQKLGIRDDLHLKPDGKGGMVKKKAEYNLTKENKKRFCEYLANVKFPDGYAANLARCVDLETYKVHGLKTHDCHILLQQVIPAALRGLVRKDIYEAIAELGNFFRQLCSKTLRVDVLHQMKEDIPVILSKLERIFPPAFFDVMVHLAVHLPEEAILRGPVHYGWMYPIERRLGYLKGTVRNRAKPEGSIAEAYVVDECLSYCSRYLTNIETRFNKEDRNKDGKRNVSSDELAIFSMAAKGLGASKLNLYDTEYDEMVWDVLNNCPDVDKYMKVCREELRMKGVANIEQTLKKEFPTWFEKHIHNIGEQNVSEDLYSLSCGPDKRLLVYSACNVNGVRYHTLDRERKRRTQNSGIMVKGEKNGAEILYYGVLKEVLELMYSKNKHGDRSVYLFRCDWYDITSKTTGLRDDGYFKSLNHKALRYKKDPFILASQAEQVFYMEDTHLGKDWKVVQTFSHRHLYDVPESETGELNATDAYQEDIVAPTFTVNDVDPVFHTFGRDDEEGTPVDPKIIAEIEKIVENNDEDSATDEDEQEDDGLSGNRSEHSSDDEV